MNKKVRCIFAGILFAGILLALAAVILEGTGKDKVDEIEDSTAMQAEMEPKQPETIAAPSPEPEPPETITAPSPEPEQPETNGYLICIDAGHQQRGNSEKEPIGPGATEQKAKVSGGTRGCVSGLAEYELTLILAQKLQAELKSRGYQVLMVRTKNDVNISNSERAGIANDARADAFIRIHADGSENASANGAMTICQTPQNPYNSQLYEASRSLSDCVLEGLVNAAGCKKRSVWETDTMSGINWCQVPVTIVEVGFMTNETEDALLATEDYQNKLASGMADGIERYFSISQHSISQ